MPATYLSVHLITNIIATEGIPLGSPVLLKLKSEHGDMEITLFFKDEDADRTLRLVDAINSAMIVSAKAAACPHEAAAYEAQHYAYQGLER